MSKALDRIRAIGRDDDDDILSGDLDDERRPKAVPTEVHRRTIGLLRELLALPGMDNNNPLNGMVVMLRRFEPILLRDFAEVPPAKVVAFTNELGQRLLDIGRSAELPPAPEVAG